MRSSSSDINCNFPFAKSCDLDWYLCHTHTHTHTHTWCDMGKQLPSHLFMKHFLKIKSAFSFYYIYCHFHTILYLYHRICICFGSWASLGGPWDKCPCFSDFSCKTAGSRTSVLSSLKKEFSKETQIVKQITCLLCGRADRWTWSELRPIGVLSLLIQGQSSGLPLASHLACACIWSDSGFFLEGVLI